LGTEKVQSFEDLWIWQQAREFVKEIYSDFNQGKGRRDFGFRDQIQRAGLSIMNNIAEGFERKSDADFARFLDFSKASCGETRSMYYTAEDLGYVNHDTAEHRRKRAKKISSAIFSLKSHLRNNKKQKK